MPTERPLLYPPVFDGRAILYPNADVLRDYLAWRQVDCKLSVCHLVVPINL